MVNLFNASTPEGSSGSPLSVCVPLHLVPFEFESSDSPHHSVLNAECKKDGDETPASILDPPAQGEALRKQHAFQQLLSSKDDELAVLRKKLALCAPPEDCRFDGVVEEVSSLRAMLDNARLTEEDTAERLANFDAVMADKDDRVDQLAEELEEAVADADALRAELRSVRSEFELNAEGTGLLDSNLRRTEEDVATLLGKLETSSPGKPPNTRSMRLQRQIGTLQKRVRSMEVGHAESIAILNCQLVEEKSRVEELLSGRSDTPSSEEAVRTHLSQLADAEMASAEKLTELQAAKAALVAKSEESADKIAMLQAELADSQKTSSEKLTELEDEKAALIAKSEESADEIAKMQAELADSQKTSSEKLTELEDEKAALIAKSEESADEIAKMQAELADSQKTSSEKLTELEDEKAALIAKSEESADEIAKMQAELADSQKTSSEKLTELEDEKAALIAKSEESADEIAKMQAELADSQKTSSEKLTELEDEKAALIAKSEESADEIAKMQAELADSQKTSSEKLTELEDEKAALIAKSEESADEIAKMQAELADSQKTSSEKLTELEDEKAALIAKSEESADEIAKMQAELADSQKTSSEKLTELEDEKAALIAKSEESADEIAKMQAELADSQKTSAEKLTELQAAKAALVAKSEESADEIAKMQAELAGTEVTSAERLTELQVAQAALIAKSEESADEIAKMQAELADAQRRITEKAAEVDELRSLLDAVHESSGTTLAELRRRCESEVQRTQALTLSLEESGRRVQATCWDAEWHSLKVCAQDEMLECLAEQRTKCQAECVALAASCDEAAVRSRSLEDAMSEKDAVLLETVSELVASSRRLDAAAEQIDTLSEELECLRATADAGIESVSGQRSQVLGTDAHSAAGSPSEEPAAVPRPIDAADERRSPAAFQFRHVSTMTAFTPPEVSPKKLGSLVRKGPASTPEPPVKSTDCVATDPARLAASVQADLRRSADAYLSISDMAAAEAVVASNVAAANATAAIATLSTNPIAAAVHASVSENAATAARLAADASSVAAAAAAGCVRNASPQRATPRRKPYLTPDVSYARRILRPT